MIETKPHILCLIHLFPREIDDFENVARQLHINHQYNLCFDISYKLVLNLNIEIFDWEKSKIPKEFFISKFNHLIDLLSSTGHHVDSIISNSGVWGQVELRKELQLETRYDGFLLIDPDMIFPNHFLHYLGEVLKSSIDYRNCVISPKMYSFWDSSWDEVCTNSYSPSVDTNQLDPYIVHVPSSEITLKQTSFVKFAGGWCTFLGSEVMTSVPFPTGVRGYGLEDTFIGMYCNKVGIKQYVLDGISVQENRKFLNNSLYVNYVPMNIELLKQTNEQNKQKFTKVMNSWIK